MNILITGASSGIGKATVTQLEKAGYSLSLVGRVRAKLEEMYKEVKGAGANIEIYECDLSNIDSINTFINNYIRDVNSLHALINLAGIWHNETEVYANKDFEKFPQEVILETYTVGLTAPTLLVHGLLPLMGKGTKIINISGTFENGAKGWLPYYVSKRALEDLTIGLAQEFEEKGVQVNCISPSDTATEQYVKFFPQYISDAQDPITIAKHIVELCEPENKTTGRVIVVKKETEPFEGFHT